MLGRARRDRPPPVPLDAAALCGTYSYSSRDEFARNDSAPTTARVKMLWTDAKKGDSSSSAKKPPPVPPQPISIQKRELPTPPAPPQPALLPPVPPFAPVPPAPPVTRPLATDPLQQRIVKWETVLNAGALDYGVDSAMIAPPRHALYARNCSLVALVTGNAELNTSAAVDG